MPALWNRAWLLVLIFVCVGFGQTAIPPCTRCAEWNAPQEAFQIFGNTYYVGPHGVTSILITSSAGHILIDGGLPESAHLIAANIRKLGFRVEDIKLILNSHVHFDHSGGIAELQRLSGARVAASSWSASVMKDGGVGRADPQFGEIPPIPPVKDVQLLRDGETLRVGDIAVTAHSTPGHTPGGTTWTWKSCAGKTCRNIVYADSVTPVSADGFRFTKSLEYPGAVKDFEHSFAFLETVPCDILVSTHPDASGFWDRVASRKAGVMPDPMVDPEACRKLAEQGRSQLRNRIADENKP